MLSPDDGLQPASRNLRFVNAKEKLAA